VVTTNPATPAAPGEPGGPSAPAEPDGPIAPGGSGRPVMAAGRDHPVGGVDDPIAADGTPEEAWAAWPGLAGLPELRVDGWRRVTVLAAHPDDDVLAAGGTLARLAAAGATVRLVAVTDGEASHLGNPWVDPKALAARRVLETTAALDALGLAGAELVRLRLPDSGLAGVEDALAAALVEPLAGADACLAPWRGDRHPDHEATGRAAATAAAVAGVPLLEFPVWTWHWATPGDRRVPWSRAAAVPLDAARLARKNQAVSCFGSQLYPQGADAGALPILPPEEIAHFTRPREVFFR
jgi:LmbE family N-acetylglucosaminyl deacetylase